MSQAKRRVGGVPVTVLLPTYNCAEHLRAALDSVLWADEILVVDSFSTDDTLAIAREYTDRILQHAYINSAAQKNWAIPQAHYPWVFQLDSDEYLDATLQREVQAIVAAPPEGVDAYRVRRKNLIFGAWAAHSDYPDWGTRLFRRDVGRWQDREVHAHCVVPGRVANLTGHLVHNDVENVEAMMHKWGRYIRYEGDQLRKEGRVFRWHQLVVRPCAAFGKRYLLRGGWRDGVRGYYVALMWAFYTFLKYARLFELEWRAQGRPTWTPDRHER